MKTPLMTAAGRWSLLLGLAVAMGGLAGGGGGGCASSETGFVEGPVYPAVKRQTRSLDIQVSRDETEIQFTNTTAQALPACTMWVNGWFSRQLPAVAVGETVEMSLFDFKDQFGDEFRAGGFFATQKPMTLVLVQLELENELVGLVVVGDYEN